MPEYFALITRALIVLEGIALTGDKDFDLFQAAYPLAAAHAARLFGSKELAVMLQSAAAANLQMQPSGSGGSRSSNSTSSSSSDARQEVPMSSKAGRARSSIQRTLSLKATTWV